MDPCGGTILIRTDGDCRTNSIWTTLPRMMTVNMCWHSKNTLNPQTLGTHYPFMRDYSLNPIRDPNPFKVYIFIMMCIGATWQSYLHSMNRLYSCTSLRQTPYNLNQGIWGPLGPHNLLVNARDKPRFRGLLKAKFQWKGGVLEHMGSGP